MAKIVFPVSSAPGERPQEGSGRLVNCYAVKTEQGARSPILWKGSAGLRQILNITAHSHCRGAILVGSTLLIVLDERVYAVTLSAGVFAAVNLGALSGTDPVTIARNNAATPNIVAVCAAGVFNLFTNSAPTSFADPDMPALNSVAGINGYIVGTTRSGNIWSTGLNAVTVASDAFTSALMKPDGLRRGVAFAGRFYAMGDDSIQVYSEDGSTPFPLRYEATIPRGICGTHAVAGWEDGWVGELLWAGEDNIVYQLAGYTPKPVSNDDVSRAIASAADRTAIVAHVYMDGPNAFWCITSPGQWSWELNLTTGAWNERQSYGRADWRARCAVKAFDRWIVGDDATGKLFQIDSAYHQEDGGPLVWELTSGANAAFPARIAIPRADFDFTAAVGLAAGSVPIETDPAVMISWSLDGGYTWGSEVIRRLGKQGQGGKLVTVTPIGLSKGKGVRFRLRISDPVHRAFLGGEMSGVNARAA